MSKSVPKRATKRWGKDFPKIRTTPAPDVFPVAAPLSLPPADAGQAQLATVKPPPQKCTKCGTLFLKRQDICAICGEWSPEKQKLHPSIRKEDDSPVRVTALKIVTMRAAGLSDEEIAKGLGIAKSTLYSYVYKAGKNGWLDFDDPKDQLEYQLMHKVVRNLDQALDDEYRNEKTGEQVKTRVALEMAAGALYPKLAGAAQVTTGPALVGIKIQIVGGDPGTMREGTIMGGADYIDVEPE